MKVSCVDSKYNNSLTFQKHRFTAEMIERANEATIGSRNYFNTHRIKTTTGHIIESDSHPVDGISIKIRNKWGKIISEENLTREKLTEAFGKAYDKIMGRK